MLCFVACPNRKTVSTFAGPALFAEHAIEDRVDMLEVIGIVKAGIDLFVGKLRSRLMPAWVRARRKRWELCRPPSLSMLAFMVSG